MSEELKGLDAELDALDGGPEPFSARFYGTAETGERWAWLVATELSDPEPFPCHPARSELTVWAAPSAGKLLKLELSAKERGDRPSLNAVRRIDEYLESLQWMDPAVFGIFVNGRLVGQRGVQVYYQARAAELFVQPCNWLTKGSPTVKTGDRIEVCVLRPPGPGPRIHWSATAHFVTGVGD